MINLEEKNIKIKGEIKLIYEGSSLLFLPKEMKQPNVQKKKKKKKNPVLYFSFFLSVCVYIKRNHVVTPVFYDVKSRAP